MDKGKRMKRKKKTMRKIETIGVRRLRFRFGFIIFQQESKPVQGLF
jgi:hypothetical protein